MSKQLQLTIPTPCHENWDNMTPVDKGKFCGCCQKQVVDFSNMNDRQVAEFFKKPSTGSICGRFMSDQLDRSIEIPKKRIPWLKYFFQFVIPAFLVSIRASAERTQGKIKVRTETTDTTKVPFPEQLITMGTAVSRPILVKPLVKKQVADAIKKSDCSRRMLGQVAFFDPVSKMDTSFLKGSVIDEKGEPVPFASIETNEPGKGVIADENGSFEISKSWLKTRPELLISSAGFESKTINTAITETDLSGIMNVQLKANVLLPEVVVTSGVNYRMGAVMYGQVIIFTKEITNPPPVAEEKRIWVYPNPVRSGTSLNLAYKKLVEGAYQLQLINLSGQPVLQQEIRINADEKLLNISIPPVAAGNYFLVLADKKSGKKFTEKVIIQ
jgi:hypothetical protein